MTGLEVLEKVRKAEQELDKFNLVIAEWRIEHGMSIELTRLYRAMGNLSTALINTERLADLSSLIANLDKPNNSEG